MHRLEQLLAAEMPPRFAALPPPTGAMSLDNVSYAAPGSHRALVHGVQLDIAPGEIVGVVGPSGSGKSTLARLLTGIVPPNVGCVRIASAVPHSTAAREH
jgi:ABC-type protease/lipase transport system fused ATPase/permease subunit